MGCDSTGALRGDVAGIIGEAARPRGDVGGDACTRPRGDAGETSRAGVAAERPRGDTGETLRGDDTGETSLLPRGDAGETSLRGGAATRGDTGETSLLLRGDAGETLRGETSLRDDTGETSLRDDTGETLRGDAARVGLTVAVTLPTNDNLALRLMLSKSIPSRVMFSLTSNSKGWE